MAFFPEQEYKISTKSEEELKRFTLEEDLNEVQRSNLILTKGSQIQKRAIYNNLNYILKEPKAFDMLFKVIQEEIQQQEEEYQILAAKSIQRFVQEQLKLPDSILYQIIGLCYKMLRFWSQPVLDQWYLLIDSVIKQISIDIIFSEILNFTLNLTDQSQPTVSKYMASRIIGTLTEIKQDQIKGPLFDRARILCQDTDVEVRRIMAEEVLPRICSSITRELLETYILEKILELVYDSDIIVKCAGIKLIFGVANRFSEEEKKNRVMKMFFDMLNSQNENVVVTMSALSGPTYQGLHPFISKNLQQQLQFLNLFREYGLNKNIKVRKQFAYNFPGVLSLAEPKRFDFFTEAYFKCLQEPGEVQLILLSSIGHIIKMVQQEFSPSLVQGYIDIFKNDDPKLLEKALEQYLMILSQITQEKKDDEEEKNQVQKKNFQVMQAQLTEDMFNVIISLYYNLTEKHQWNLQSQLLSIFIDAQELLWHIYFNNDKFMTLVQFCLKTGNGEIRKLAAFNFAKYLSWLPDLKRRNDDLSTFRTMLFDQNNCYMKIVYIDFVEACLDLFSKKFFAQHEIFNVLDFASECVISVRIRLVKIMVALQRKIDPDSEELNQKYSEALAELYKIKDKSFQIYIKELKEGIQAQNQEGPNFWEQVNNQDMLMQVKEDEIFLHDLKLRQMQDDQDKDDYDIKNEFVSEYLNKFKKRYALFGSKAMNAKTKLNGSHSTNNLQGNQKMFNTTSKNDFQSHFNSKAERILQLKKFSLDIGKSNDNSKQIPQSQPKPIGVPSKQIESKMPQIAIRPFPEPAKNIVQKPSSQPLIQSQKSPLDKKK